jgi:hypothetical protein
VFSINPTEIWRQDAQFVAVFLHGSPVKTDELDVDVGDIVAFGILQVGSDKNIYQTRFAINCE